MADMTHEKVTFSDDVVLITRRQLLVAEGLLGALILAAKTLTNDKLSGLLANFNQWLYHPETIPALAFALVDEEMEEE